MFFSSGSWKVRNPSQVVEILRSKWWKVKVLLAWNHIWSRLKQGLPMVLHTVVCFFIQHFLTKLLLLLFSSVVFWESRDLSAVFGGTRSESFGKLVDVPESGWVWPPGCLKWRSPRTRSNEKDELPCKPVSGGSFFVGLEIHRFPRIFGRKNILISLKRSKPVPFFQMF